MSFFISDRDSKARLREAERARENRLEIVKAHSLGQITRRDMLKMGLITAGGVIAPIHGLSPFVSSAYGAIPTGTPRSPVPRVSDKPFTQPLLRMHGLTPHALTLTGGSDAQLMWPSAMGEAPAMRRSNTNIIRHKVNLANATNTGNVTFQVAFGEFGGAYVNHCHNTVHEDNAMLLRYDVIRGNSNATGIDDVHITVLPTPDPRPEGVTYVNSCYLAGGNPQKFDTGVDVCSEKEIGPAVPSSDPRTR